MTLVPHYTDAALDLGSTPFPIEPGSLALPTNHILDELQSASQIAPDLVVNRGKRAQIEAACIDPSLVTDWTLYDAGQTFTNMVARWRAYEDRDNLSSTWYSWTSTKGVIHPVSLTGDIQTKAIMQVRVIPVYDSGTQFATGSAAGTVASVTKSYYPTSITIAGDAKTEIRDVNVTWDFNVRFSDQVEASFFFYDRKRLSGSVTLKDLTNDATLTRVEDGVSETVSILFTDSENGANTVVVNLGVCWVEATLAGEFATITFKQVL